MTVAVLIKNGGGFINLGQGVVGTGGGGGARVVGRVLDGWGGGRAASVVLITQVILGHCRVY